MSKINKSRNLFLEKEELVRQDRFTQDDGLESFIKSITKNGGIVPDSEGSLGNNFLPVFTDYGYVTFSEDSVAYNTQGERIYFKYQSFYQYKLPTDTVDELWMYIQKGVTSIEEGTIQMGVNGTITGSGTSFTELFRGQTSLVPNKIKIYSKTESSAGGSGYTYTSVGTYEVNEVESDTVMYVNAFDALSGIAYVYSVVGAFSPGTFDESREEEIYEYDFVDVVFSQTDPTDTLTDDQYLLAKITIDSATSANVSIEDLRGVCSIGISASTWVDISDEVSVYNPEGFANIYSLYFAYKINNDNTVSIKCRINFSYYDIEDVDFKIYQKSSQTLRIGKTIEKQRIDGYKENSYDEAWIAFIENDDTDGIVLQFPLEGGETYEETLVFITTLQTGELWPS